MNYQNINNERFIGPFLPFLGGALIGGAAVGLTRPRPIYNVAPYQNYGFNPYRPYGNYSYSYYVPGPYGY
jgi:hypothetical protein